MCGATAGRASGALHEDSRRVRETANAVFAVIGSDRPFQPDIAPCEDSAPAIRTSRRMSWGAPGWEGSASSGVRDQVSARLMSANSLVTAACSSWLSSVMSCAASQRMNARTSLYFEKSVISVVKMSTMRRLG